MKEVSETCRPGLLRCTAVLPALARAVCTRSWPVASGGRGALRWPSCLTASEALPQCPWQALDGCACSPRALGGLGPAVFSDVTERVPANVRCQLLGASGSGGLPRVVLGSLLPALGCSWPAPRGVPPPQGVAHCPAAGRVVLSLLLGVIL